MLIKNVVKVESVVLTVYPRWSDYGCLVNGVRVVTFENGNFFVKEYVTEMGVEEVEGVELEFEFVDMLNKYEEYLLNERIKYSKENGHSCQAKKGDTIEIYKERKYPIGTRFTVDHEYEYHDMYGKIRELYWVDKNGRKVSKFNTIIVKDA